MVASAGGSPVNAGARRTFVPTDSTAARPDVVVEGATTYADAAIGTSGDVPALGTTALQGHCDSGPFPLEPTVEPEAGMADGMVAEVAAACAVADLGRGDQGGNGANRLCF